MLCRYYAVGEGLSSMRATTSAPNEKCEKSDELMLSNERSANRKSSSYPAAYADVCKRMLTYADVCSRMRGLRIGRAPSSPAAYADVC